MTAAEAQANLRLVESTGEVVCARCEQLEAEAERLKGDLENIEQGELRRLRAANTRLQGERHKTLKVHPRAQDAARVYAYWRERCHPRAQKECPADRLELILARLKNFTADELCRAVDGAAQAPFVDERGKRHDGLELVMRNTGKVWDFIGRVDPVTVEAPPAERKPHVAPPKSSDLPDAQKASGVVYAHRSSSQSGDARGFFAALGIQLPGWDARNVPVRCFADPQAHSRGDRSVSCSVSTETGAWCCHACGAAGGAYDAALASGRAPREAMELLEAHGLVGSVDVGIRTADGGGPDPVSASREAMVDRARRTLAGDQPLLARLGELRGWSGQAVVSLGLGVADGRVVFPIRDGQGRLVGVNRYAPNPARRSGPKLIADQGSRRELFPAPETLAGGDVWVVEGEPDSVAARTLGLSAVGVPGVQGWKAGWAGRFVGRRVAVCMDCDPQGRKAAGEITADLVEAGVAATAVDLAPLRDDGHDLGDLVVALPRGPAGVRRGAEVLRRLWERAG